MISLRQSSTRELADFHALDCQPHAQQFIISTPLETHRENFSNPDIVYLSIDTHEGQLAGYFILVIEGTSGSVEFRRIVVDQHRKGIGQEAIRQMERYCQTELHATRLWLDVFEDNAIGRHIYAKLGYKHFKTDTYDGRPLLFFEKML